MTSNSTGLDCTRISYHQSDTVVASLYFCTFPIALFLNGAAAWISVHLRTTSSFMVYLKHLVAADLLVTLTLPIMAASNLPGAGVSLKAFACRYTDVIFYCCLYTSICLMGLISLDRFFKIVRPGGKLFGQSLVFSHVTAACVWAMLVVGTAIPTVILTNLSPGEPTGDLCMSMKGPAGVTLHRGVILSMEVLFWLVSVVIVICYACITKRIVESFRKSGSNNRRGKRKTKLRVFLVILVFFVCFMPLHVLRVPQSRETHDPVCVKQWLKVAYDVTLWLSSTNVCLDPLLYVFLCKEFRAKLGVMMQSKAAIPKSQLEIEVIASQ